MTRIVFVSKTNGGYSSDMNPRERYINLFLEPIKEIDTDKLSDIFDGDYIKVSIEAFK